MDRSEIDIVRRFNRAVTRRVGALQESYLARGRPLGEARMMFEVGRAGGIELRALREVLGLDSGYASRLLRSLERQGLVEVSPTAGDARARHVVLTAAGVIEYEAYDRLSDELAISILEAMPAAARMRLASAMDEVERLLRGNAIGIAVERPDGADARWAIGQYFAELDRRFEEGFDPGLGGGFDAVDYTPPSGWFVLARLDGRAVGCGVLKRLDAGAGEIKRVWTAPQARGLGVAGRIMDRLEALAAEAGFERVILDTNKVLTEAQAMYRKRGYREIGRYNDNPYAHCWFEKAL